MTTSHRRKEASPAMLRPCILLFIVFNLFNSFYCRERSDWSYDHETQIANRTTANGTTYSCKAWDIIQPIMSKRNQLYINTQPCLINSSLAANDRACMSTAVLNILSETMNSMVNRSCVVPIPTAEEVFERVEKIYRSSLNESPATREWVSQVSQNASKIRESINGTEDALQNDTSMSSREQSLKNVCSLTAIAFVKNTFELPKLRDEVSALESVLHNAKLRESVLIGLGSDDPEWQTDNADARERLLGIEIMALIDSPEFELITWRQVEQIRSLIIRDSATKMRRKHEMAVVKQNIAEARMSMLSKMAQANMMLADIEANMREVEYHMERAQPVVDDESETEG